MYWLDILDGASRGRRMVQRRVYSAGSDLSCQLWISDEGIAPRHAEFEARDGGVLVRPLDPAAPVLVNGQPAAEGRLLSDGDTIELASTRIRYRARLALLTRFRSELTSALFLAVAVGAIGYGAWLYLHHRAGLDRVDLRVTATPIVALPVPPPAQGSEKLAVMERLGAGTEAATPSPPPTSPAPRVATLPRPPPPSVAQSSQIVTRTPPVPVVSGPTNPPAVAATPAPTGMPAVVAPTMPPSTATILAHADALVRAGSLDAAAAKYEALIVREPRCMAARAGLARIAEKRGYPQVAERLWTTVLQNSAGDPLYDEAFKELIRLAELQLRNAPPPLTVPVPMPPVPVPPVPAPVVVVAPAPSPVVTPRAPTVEPPQPSASVTSRPAVVVAPPVAPKPTPPPVRPAETVRPAPTSPAPIVARLPAPVRPAAPQIPAVRIATAEMTRFPAGEDREDFRVLQINLAADEARASFPAERVTVSVVFYDRTAPTGGVAPSRLVISHGRVPLAAGPWNPGDTRMVTVPYAIPKISDAPATARFHGYRIRVYSGDRLSDELAKPSTLPSLP